jgi:hypothetical protein
MLKKTDIIPVLALVSAVYAVSCSGPTRISAIKFPSTPVVSTTDSVALVLDPYVALRDQPGEKGITVEHARRAEIYPVQGKRILVKDSNSVVWIHLEKGWIPEASVRLYQNTEKASLAAKNLEE